MIHPVDYAPSQNYGDNPTRWLPWDHWLIRMFGNYQPDGHTGTDYPCKSGTPVRAVTAGTVLHAGYFGGSYADNPWWIMPSFAGYTYVVDHGWFIGIYGHCRDGGSKVRVGQRVAEGQELGPSGNTGASTGDHLHFEVLPGGFILNSYMYGRIDPAVIFATINTPVTGGALQPAGTTTLPIQEDDMFSDADRENLEKSIRQQGVILGMLNNMAGWMNNQGTETQVNVQRIRQEQLDDAAAKAAQS